MTTPERDAGKPDRYRVDTSKATEASNATFARRRAVKAVAELESQGYRVTLDPPLHS